MPRPLPFNNTELNDTELNSRTVDVIGNLDSLNPLYFPNSNLVDAINAVPSMMNKTFYVDSINGNDSNDGSSSAPFQTVAKAISSVPVGGRGYITIYGDAIINSSINITGKQIVLSGGNYDTTNSVATQTLTLDSSTYSNFIVSGGISALYIYGFNIVSVGNNSAASNWKNMFKVYNGSLYLYIGFYNKPSDLIVDYPILNIEDGFAFVRLKGQSIKTNSTNSISLITKFSAASYIYTSFEVTDTTNGLVVLPNTGLN